MSERDPSVERWGKTWEVFHRVLESSELERAATLERLCGGDSELLREVEGLLEAHAEGLSIAERPPPDLGDPTQLDPSEREETIAAGRGLLEPGSVLAERFEILRLVGLGGMGEVYEAHDRELGTRVAVKTLLPALASSPASLARFRKEILLARQVTHRNVCRIFDLVQHDGLAFLTMEHLEGETLASRLEKLGRMTLAETRAILGQLVAGLEAAHAVGVVHRDLKPSNVLLVDEAAGRRAVITDFGLATTASDGSLDAAQLTGTGEILGTPAYMAPEQLEGRETGPTTDIYALGLLLYEMVTGRRPFTGSSPFSIASRRLEGPAPSPRKHLPDLDSRWEAAILRCLERTPAERFQSPAQLLEALDERPAQPAPYMASATKALRPRLFVLLVVLAALALSLWIWQRATRGHPPTTMTATEARDFEPPLLLITDFDNRTGEEAMSGVLETALARELVNSRAVGVVSRQRILDTLRLMDTPANTPIGAALGQEVALRDGGISLVADGRVEKLGSTYVLTVDLTRPDDGELLSSLSEETDRQEGALEAVRRLAERVEREMVRRAPGAVRPSGLPAVSTPSLAALKLYAEAEQLLVEEGFGGPDLNEAAERLLAEAIAEDPEFASAHIFLAWAIARQGRPPEELIAHARRAFELSDHASPVERAFIRGSYHSFLADLGGEAALGHRKEAVAQYQALLRLDPNHYWVVGNLTHELESLGRGREAAELAIWGADTAHPNRPSAAALAAWFVIRYIGDVENARRYYERVKQLVEGVPLAPSENLDTAELWLSTGYSLTLHELWLEDDIDGLVAELQRQVEQALGASSLTRTVLLSNGVHMSLDLGMYRRAAEIAELSGMWSPEDWERLLSWRKLDIERLREVLPRDPDPNPSDTTRRALDLAAVGLTDESEALVEALPEFLDAPSRGNVEVARATIAMARGRPQQAVSRLEEGLPLLKSQDYLASYFMAAVRASNAWRSLGYPDRAARVLEEANRQRSRMIRGGRFYWMLAELHRAEVYRDLGRNNEANEIEARLWSLSAHADPDFPILVELERRQTQVGID